jgi:stress-induced morphogen
VLLSFLTCLQKDRKEGRINVRTQQESTCHHGSTGLFEQVTYSIWRVGKQSHFSVLKVEGDFRDCGIVLIARHRGCILTVPGVD